MTISYKVKHFGDHKVRDGFIATGFFGPKSMDIWIYSQFLFHWHFIYRRFTFDS